MLFQTLHARLRVQSSTRLSLRPLFLLGRRIACTTRAHSRRESASCWLFEIRIRTPCDPIAWVAQLTIIHAGAWSLAPSSPRVLRSTSALVRRGASFGLSNKMIEQQASVARQSVELV